MLMCVHVKREIRPLLFVDVSKVKILVGLLLESKKKKTLMRLLPDGIVLLLISLKLVGMHYEKKLICIPS